MKNLIRLGVFVAAGVGTYEILRRYGLLQKAGDWLSQQVPDEYKDQARQYVEQARERAGEYGGQIRERANEYTGQLRERAGQYGERAQKLASQATEAVRHATGYDAQAAGSRDGGVPQSGNVTGPTSNGHTGGPQNLTGPGRGTTTNVDEGTGVHASHTVGRGVVR